MKLKQDIHDLARKAVEQSGFDLDDEDRVEIRGVTSEECLTGPPKLETVELRVIVFSSRSPAVKMELTVREGEVVRTEWELA